jgi:SagB-type dehydrogenase family enzyme
VRPLVDQVPRQEPGGVVFDLGWREVRVDGDPALILQVLALCDGRRTVEEIAEVVGSDVPPLLEELERVGVVFDSARAWRRFHQRVNSPAPGPVGEVGPAYRPEGLGVGRALAAGGGALLRLAARRESSFPGERRALSFEELSVLLRAVYGRGASGTRRTVPSGGALYPLLVHALVRSELGPLEAGLWWLDAEADAVELVAREVAVEPLILREEVADGLLAAGQPVVFVSADVERPGAKYQNKAYPLALMEAGAAMQSAYLAAAELGVPIRAIAGVDDRATRRALALPDGAVPLLALLLGR